MMFLVPYILLLGVSNLHGAVNAVTAGGLRLQPEISEWCGSKGLFRFSVLNSGTAEVAMTIRPSFSTPDNQTWPGDYDLRIGDLEFFGRLGCRTIDGARATCEPDARTVILLPGTRTTWQITLDNVPSKAAVRSAKLSIRVRAKGVGRRGLIWSGKLTISKTGDDCWRVAAVQPGVGPDGR
jgi:hypothetical protein